MAVKAQQSNANFQSKIATVQEIEGKLKNAKSVVFVKNNIRFFFFYKKNASGQFLSGCKYKFIEKLIHYSAPAQPLKFTRLGLTTI